MAKWDASASTQFQKLPRSSHATDQQMADLRQRINTWADAQGGMDGNGSFPFSPLKMRDSAVGVRTSGG